MNICLVMALLGFAGPLENSASAGRPLPPPAQLEQALRLLRGQGLVPETIRSVNYHVLYVGRREFAEERKVSLEKTRQQFLGFMRRLNVKTKTPNEQYLVIVLDTADQMRNFHVDSNGGELSGWVAGYYSPKHNWAVFYNQRKGDDVLETQRRLEGWARRLNEIPGGPDVIVEVTTKRGVVSMPKRRVAAEMQREWERIVEAVVEYNIVVTQHEGAHQLAFNVGVQDRTAAYPFWVSEGLACVFETPPGKSGRNRRGAARVNAARLADFKALQAEGKALGIRRLLTVDPANPPEDVGALYAESWAVFAFLFDWHAKKLSAYLRTLAKRTGAPERSAIDELAVFEEHFKRPIDQLQQEFDRYIKTRE